MYEKYEVKNAQELEYIWKHYLILKSDQEKLEENELEKSEMKGLLQSLLQKHDVYDTSIWIYQVEALIDNKEMVEVRHKLNANRTILRKQIAYNDNQSEEIKRILKELAEERAYARELVGKII